ncbi:DUF1097 domain-containing protein [Muricauda oceani]|uniref:DUF1097 domain-containing protein n=1 Tax=Flagellimonas oceani TaxID=2698672 RepID=A0A6G7IY66_9FLAO|nr:DUF1097 domain-containing protein [Allomuricauda oceani]MBW8244889.1 DUF1097 domain-containing protein [Allomuricauda oceani]QII43551.1 DUF1097 domain-containing protein [Allomuricauda oceani]
MKTLITGLSMGLLGALAVFVTFSLQWPTWVLFIAWVSYYLFGMSIKASLHTLLNMTAGFLLGILMATLTHMLEQGLGRFAMPTVVLVCISLLPYLSKIRYLENIPAWFLGLIVYFGVHPPLEARPVLNIFAAIIAGFVFAFVNHRASLLIARSDNDQLHD